MSVMWGAVTVVGRQCRSCGMRWLCGRASVSVMWGAVTVW